ncbi:hypothetical protein F2P81_014350 [Scophthalmus maximus]|uniref:Uncharacterized protein n=1 Tax=Scophthalmus maximus TaxID=52904 RepID=A0A6A4STC4_SCOMX|nr:hypothetical protein F2P81_014350 [Scophthalmus maximus]
MVLKARRQLKVKTEGKQKDMESPDLIQAEINNNRYGPRKKPHRSTPLLDTRYDQAAAAASSFSKLMAGPFSGLLERLLLQDSCDVLLFIKVAKKERKNDEDGCDTGNPW